MQQTHHQSHHHITDRWVNHTQINDSQINDEPNGKHAKLIPNFKSGIVSSGLLSGFYPSGLSSFIASHKLSKLAVAVVAVMTQPLMVQFSHAAETGSSVDGVAMVTESQLAGLQDINTETGEVNWTQYLSDSDKTNINSSELTTLTEEEVQQALAIMRLKQAVEAGLVDASELSEYTDDLDSSSNTTDGSQSDNQYNQYNQSSSVNSEVAQQSNLQQVITDEQAIQNSANQNKGYQMLSLDDLSSQLAETGRLADSQSEFDMPIARLGSDSTPIGLDEALLNSSKLARPENDTQANNTDIDDAYSASSLTNSVTNNLSNSVINDVTPDALLPELETTNTIDNSLNNNQATQEYQKKQANFFERTYNNLFNNGEELVERVDTQIYLRSIAEQGNDEGQLIEVDTNNQPAKNIKAAIDEFPVESVADFAAALPLIRTAAEDAAEAVGFYDVSMKFRQPSEDVIDVIIESVGEPVRVSNSVLELRGGGEEFVPYQDVQAAARPKVGDEFNHREYTETKTAIEKVSTDYGYFDGHWLNSSADIILPDNVADVNMVYDSGERYKFDDVVFYTLKDGKISDNPDDLPLKEELLQQLVEFENGEGYEASKVTNLTNDLFATRYFNGIEVEAVLPSTNQTNSQVNFEESAGAEPATLNNVETEDLASENLSIDNLDASSSIDAGLSGSSADLTGDGSDTSATISQRLAEEEQPLVFNIDDSINEKLQVIQSKADRLYDAPDDLPLNEISHESKSLLGKISDGISEIATKILPDEPVRAMPEDGGENAGRQEVVGKKSAQEVQQSKKVPTYVMVVADKPRDAEIGLGYGTDTGVRVSAKYDDNLINRDGYKAGVEASWSQVEKEAKAYVSRPWKHPLNDTLTGSVSYVEEDLDLGDGSLDLTTSSYLGSVSRNIISDTDWNKTYSLRYRRDELQTGLDPSEYEELPIEFTSGNLTQEALLAGVGVSKTVADDISNPKHGWKQAYSLEVGADGLVTDTNMVIAKAAVSGVHSFGEDDRHQVVGKVDTGYLWSNNFTDVPYQLRFFAGGDKSIRGYDYKSLSPLENGYLIGGEVLAVASGEYNYEFIPGLRAAVFADVGNAYDKDFTADTKVGTGVGVRWESPIGPVRLDVAAGVSEDEVPIRLHFYIGTPLQ